MLWSDLFLTQYACRPPHRRLQRQVALKICADRSVKLHMALSIGLRFISCKLYTERPPLQDQLPHVASRLLSKSVQTGLWSCTWRWVLVEQGSLSSSKRVFQGEYHVFCWINFTPRVSLFSEYFCGSNWFQLRVQVFIKCDSETAIFLHRECEETWT